MVSDDRAAESNHSFLKGFGLLFKYPSFIKKAPQSLLPNKQKRDRNKVDCVMDSGDYLTQIDLRQK